ncbi:hypothetical protein KUTeg_012598 [Tegillarca granosa]|uniref:Uncharacterized protein n=1 Tax=Tegillarca granosa TaxID=220873 RepID=A0ABQ9F013_TEGGR|nr:hypothetical protein KUTeg_012598 [Tegillarca granosa]
MMDLKLQSMEQKIYNSQRDLHEAQIGKIQAAATENFNFKRKGNEAQFKFNNSVIEKLVISFYKYGKRKITQDRSRALQSITL